MRCREKTRSPSFETELCRFPLPSTPSSLLSSTQTQPRRLQSFCATIGRQPSSRPSLKSVSASPEVHFIRTTTAVSCPSDVGQQSDLVLSAASVRSASCTCTFEPSLGCPTRSGTPRLAAKPHPSRTLNPIGGTSEHLNTICEFLRAPLSSLNADRTCGCSTGTQTHPQPPTHLNLSPTIPLDIDKRRFSSASDPAHR